MFERGLTFLKGGQVYFLVLLILYVLNGMTVKGNFNTLKFSKE